MTSSEPRTLVAGLGNIFLGDDAFGVELAKRLLSAPVPPEVRILDVGIRSMHLAYELVETRYETVIFLDAIRRDGEPGTLYVLEAAGDVVPTSPAPDGHTITPGDVLALVRTLGGRTGRVVIVACEALRIDQEAGLSLTVAAAVDEAVPIVERLIAESLANAAAPTGA